MKNYKEILNVIDNTSYLYTDYILKQIKQESSLEFISQIIDKTGKEISEAILAFLSAIKYIYPKNEAIEQLKKSNSSENLESSAQVQAPTPSVQFRALEANNSFQNFIKKKYNQIINVSEKNVQANLPERALPILEVLIKKLDEASPISMIELGASFGLIGRCLLNPEKAIENKEDYFSKKQQIPKQYKGIKNYLGIEIDPPDKEWLLAAIWDKDIEKRTKQFIDSFEDESGFELIESSAVGFSKLEQVNKLVEKKEIIVVLTSFMLYQFDDESKNSLTNEIIEFTKSINGHWINQAVNISKDSDNNEFFISWDNERIIELTDDTCSRWWWPGDEMTKKLTIFFENRPDIFEKKIFDGTFREYAKVQIESMKTNTHKSFLRDAIIKQAKGLLSDQINVEDLERQLENYPIISTADHHGLLNYKLLYNSNILYKQFIEGSKLPFLVVLSSGSVPMVNISHPRGFFFKGQKFNFFSERKCKVPAFLFKDRLNPDSPPILDSILSSYNKESITEEEKKFLEFLFFECLEIEKVKKYDSFSDQITILNFKLWKYYFDKSIRDNIPDIVYIQANEIYSRALMDEIKKDDSITSKILFDQKKRKIYHKNFSGLQGCWGKDMGSDFFWGIIERKKKKKLVKLSVSDFDNALIGDDFNLNLNKDEVVEALNQNKILPTLFFDFLIITFLEGFMALGGHNQIEYLPKMQKAHIKSLMQFDIVEMAINFGEPVSHGLICGMYPFDFDSGIDLIWHYNSTPLNPEKPDGPRKFNGNMDGGIPQDELDKVSNTDLTELIATGIDETLKIF